MNLSNTAKEVATQHFLSSYPFEEAHEAFDEIMEDPEVLDECVIWEPFTHYSYSTLAEWISDHAETVQEAMDEAVKAAKLAE